MMRGVRRARRNPLPAGAFVGMTLVLVAAMAGCGSNEPSVDTESLHREATLLEWPDGIPSDEALSRFYQADGGSAPARTTAQRANACLWYATWLAGYQKSAPASTTVLRYLEEVIPTLSYLRQAAGGVDQAYELSAAAKNRSPSPIQTFLTANQCSELGP